MIAESQSVKSFEQEDRQTRDLLKGLSVPRPAIYWTDLLVTSTIGWSMFIAAARATPALPIIGFGAIAVFALYRALLLIHEISHLSGRVLPGFETCWNLLVGFPLLLPSFMYVGVHQSHHSLSSYGTSDDPEYLPFAQSKGMTIVFALESFLMPAALLLRFLVAAPAGLIFPPFHRWLTRHASALTMNFSYRRDPVPQLIRKVRIGSFLVLAIWALAIATLPLRAFAVWFAVVSVISFINTLRTLVAHRYENHGDPLDRRGQLADSLDTPGAIWTELWAPVGLRFHALHHYFPGIPYHNLYKAHRILIGSLPSDSFYSESINRSLAVGLRSLLGGSRIPR